MVSGAVKIKHGTVTFTGRRTAENKVMVRKICKLAWHARDQEVLLDGIAWTVESGHSLVRGYNGTTQRKNLYEYIKELLDYSDETGAQGIMTEFKIAADDRDKEELLTIRQFRSSAYFAEIPEHMQERITKCLKALDQRRKEAAMLNQKRKKEGMASGKIKAEESNKRQQERQEMLASMQNARLRQVATAQNKDGTWKSAGEILDESFFKAKPGKPSSGSEKSPIPF